MRYKDALVINLGGGRDTRKILPTEHPELILNLRKMSLN